MAVVRKQMQRGFQMRTIWVKPLLLLTTYGLAFIAIGLLFQLAAGWVQFHADTLRYGMPRVARITGYIGHGDESVQPSTIMALNNEGQISILVLPGGDTAQTQRLTGPYLVGDDGPYAVALPSLADVNSDGHVDLLVTVRGEVLVYVNEDGAFRLITSAEYARLMEQGVALP
jgi:hypothetical protein